MLPDLRNISDASLLNLTASLMLPSTQNNLPSKSIVAASDFCSSNAFVIISLASLCFPSLILELA